jgi:hypothetical protein
MDAGSAPERIGQAHLPDQSPNFLAGRWACRHADWISSARRSESLSDATG